MDFRIILLLNGKYKKTLHQCKTRDTAFINFHRIKDENVVYFPKRFINSRGIKTAKYEIAITKTTEEDDTFRTLRDDLGKLYTEAPLGDWTIITTEPFDIEETFWLYGLEKETDRVDIRAVLKRLMINAHAKKMVKQVIVVYNKLIIYNEDQFDLVVCKNQLDAQRLHHALAKIATKQKIKSLMFMGTATTKPNISRLYDLIHEETGWEYKKIRRTTTGH